MLKKDLENELFRVQTILANVEDQFKFLSADKKAGIQKIFDANYEPDRPGTLYAVLGKVCAYILAGIE
ncbi:hypothetical protein EE88_21680 [Salmonella enterica]|nr:hypothetical protein [Salmonella enterica]